MKVLILLFTASFLLTRGIRAMKPAPFDKEYTFDAPSGVRLVSTNNEHSSGHGVTKVFGADGYILYEMPVFTGRRDIYLSPDGSVIVLDGQYYFGPRLMRPTSSPHWKDQIVTSVTSVFQKNSGRISGTNQTSMENWWRKNLAVVGQGELLHWTLVGSAMCSLMIWRMPQKSSKLYFQVVAIR